MRLQNDRLEARWAEMRRHPLFQIALVFAGASWLAIQAADVFGLSKAVVRGLGGTLVLGFVGLMLAAWIVAGRRPEGGAVSPPRRRTRTFVIAAVVLLLLGTAAWIARPMLLGGSVKAGADVIAVLPFTTSGAGLEVLGEGLVDLLSTNLDEVGGVRTINPRTSLHRWRAAAENGTLDLDGSLAIGRAVGAGSVLLGSVVEVGGQARLTAELYNLKGDVLARAQLSGAADSVLQLVDALSIELLRDIWRGREPIPSLRVSAITTSSIGALRAYLRGEQYFRRSQWDSATIAFDDALRQDSTFALASFRLSETYGWKESLGSESARRYADAAARMADRLPTRERTLVSAARLHERGDLAAIDTLDAYVRRYPDDPVGAEMLGDARYHANAIVGLSTEDVYRPFDRVIELDPSFAPAYNHVIELSASSGERARFERYLSQLAPLVDPEVLAQYRLLEAIRFGSPDSILIVAANGLGSTLPPNVATRLLNSGLAARFMAETGPGTQILLAVVDSVARVLNVPGAEQALTSFRTSVLAGRGEWRAAHAVIDSVGMSNLDFAFGVSLSTMVATQDPSWLSPALLSVLGRASTPFTKYWNGVAALVRMDTATARSVWEGGRATDTASASLTRDLWPALEAWSSILHGDTVGGARRLDTALRRIGYAPQVTSVTVPLRTALLYASLAHPDLREHALVWGRYMLLMEPLNAPHLLPHMAAALAAAGRNAEAAALYAQAVELWANADPELQPRVDAMRQAVQRLAGERN